MAKTSSNNKHNSRNEDLLSDEQISFLRALLSTDKTTLTINECALILLAIYNASGKKFTHRQIPESLDIFTSTVHRTTKHLVDLEFGE